jgi:branched-subunit amino acid transport protein
VEARSLLVLILAMAGVTYAIRLSLVLFARRRRPFPRLVERILTEVPLAAYTSIVVSTVLSPGGDIDLHPSNLYLYATAAAVAVAAWTANIIAVVVAAVAVATALYLVT